MVKTTFYKFFRYLQSLWVKLCKGLHINFVFRGVPMDDMRGNKNIYEDDIIRRESRDNYKPR